MFGLNNKQKIQETENKKQHQNHNKNNNNNNNKKKVNDTQKFEQHNRLIIFKIENLFIYDQ